MPLKRCFGSSSREAAHDPPRKRPASRLPSGWARASTAASSRSRRPRRDANAAAVDPRGTGGSAEAETYLLDDYVADVEELRVDLGEEQIDLLGFSHGGLVAAAYAIAHPGRLRKLVLTVGLAAFTPEMQAEADRVIASFAGEPWHADATAALAREEAGDYWTPEEAAEMWNAMVPLYFSRWEERYRPLVEVERMNPEPLRQFNATPFDLRPELGRIEAETLVITGRDDFICGPPPRRCWPTASRAPSS